MCLLCIQKSLNTGYSISKDTSSCSKCINATLIVGKIIAVLSDIIITKHRYIDVGLEN